MDRGIRSKSIDWSGEVEEEEGDCKELFDDLVSETDLVLDGGRCEFVWRFELSLFTSELVIVLAVATVAVEEEEEEEVAADVVVVAADVVDDVVADVADVAAVVDDDVRATCTGTFEDGSGFWTETVLVVG